MAILLPQCGVYKITCIPTGKVYIGSSLDMDARWANHKTHLRRGAAGNTYLQAAWDKYGEEAFVFEAIELCFAEVRTDRENFWIQKLKAANRKYGYNLVASPNYVAPMSDEIRAKLSASHMKPATRALKSANAKRQMAQPGAMEKLQASRNIEQERIDVGKRSRKMWSNSEYREQKRAEGIAQMKNPEQLASSLSRMNTPEASAKRREATQKRLKEMWADPEYRAAALARMNTPEAIAKRGKKIGENYKKKRQE